VARRQAREQSSSLFPFLSVLACVIGTLTLLIASLAIGQVAESLLDSRDDPAESEHLEAERAELRELQEGFDSAEHVAEELAAAKAELRARGVDPSQSEEERRRAVQVRKSAAQLATLIRRLEREDSQLQGNVRGVEIELVEERPRGDTRPIRILPHGSAPPLRPFFVECRADGVRIYDRNLTDSFYLSRGSLDDVARFRGFLQRARAVREGTVIFLIRPDGTGTYEWAARQTGKLLVRHAKLPLPTQGTLEFGL
jgi:hypothetical protein